MLQICQRYKIGLIVSIMTAFICAVTTLVFVPPLLGFGTYVADGHLEPEIKEGSICYTTYALPESIEIGNSIAYESDGKVYIKKCGEIDFESGTITVTNLGDDYNRKIDIANYKGVVQYYIPLLGALLR